MSIDWNWGIFLQQAPFGNTTYLGWLWSGFQVTVALSITAWIIAFLVGSLFGILRTVPNRFLSSIGTLYVELFRNVPLIVQFFTWYLVIPELLPEDLGMWFKAELDPNVQFFCLLYAVSGAVHRCARLRAGTCRHTVTAARAKECGTGDGPDSASGLPLRTAAERLPRHRSADDVRDDEPGKKLGYRLNHWSGRYGGAGGQTAGLFRSRMGILHGDHARLCSD
ncbi:glutamate/aspartate ABC transporter permease GltJ [Enterobacter cloacae subsp. cloacae GS1]|nr:glutamate/aspartate ABC transporter permease GltJ [Enterobacter cloacae subsp. cloacae GS1]